MPSKKMFSVLFIQNGKLFIIPAITGILVFSLLGIFLDVRFFIIALLWVFLIIPMVVAFIYFFYGMRPLTAFNTIPHTIQFSRQGITIQFYDESQNGLMYDPGKDYKIKEDCYKELKTGGDYAIVFFNKSGWLWLPVSGFDSLSEMQEAIQILDDGRFKK